MCINFRAKGGNSDTWYIVQVHSTELVHNYVIVRDWAQFFLEESKSGQSCGIGKKTHRASTRPKITCWGSEIEEIHQIKYRAPRRQEKLDQVLSRGAKDQTL